LCVRSEIPEEDYWINKQRAAAAARRYGNSENMSSTERDAVEERDSSLGERALNVVDDVVTSANNTTSSSAAADFAAASGLSSSSVQKISVLESQAIKTVEVMKSTANQKMSDIYLKEGKEMAATDGILSNPTAGKVAAQKAVAAGLTPSSVKQISSIERNAVEGINNTFETAKAAIANVYKKEGITMPNSAARSMGVPATATAIAGMAAGLGSTAIKKISAIEEKAQAKAGSIDEKALQQVAAILKSHGAKVEVPSIIGATSTAATAGLSASIVREVAALERKAADDVAILDAETAEDIEGVYNKNGLPMMSGARKAFSASRGSLMTAAAAASIAGLGATSVQKISAIETSASSKMATMDAKASAEITAVARKFGSGKFTDTDIAAALDKITGIETKVVDDMEAVDDKSIKDIEAIYKRNGFEVDPAGWEGPAIPSAAATAAADAAKVLSGSGFASTKMFRNQSHCQQESLLVSLPLS
jgi:hypothetical protein